MSAASPTPLGQGSGLPLGRRTSARQAVRRPLSRQMGRNESQPAAPAGAGASQRETRSHSRQYANANDSSDDEIPVPMKLSALTKALLNDGNGSVSGEQPSGAGVAAGAADQPGRPSSRVMTRRRSALNASTSSVPEEREKADSVPRASGRETRRHMRAGSAQLPSSRPTSPARPPSRDTSPAPRKRVVRLSATTAGAGSLQNPLKRAIPTASQPKRRPISMDMTDEKNQPLGLSQTQGQHQSQGVERPPSRTAERESAADINTPANGIRRVQIAVGSSASKLRSGGSSGVSSKRSGSAAPQSDHDIPEEPATVGRAQPNTNLGSVSRFSTSVSRPRPGDDAALQGSMRVKRVGKVPGSFLSGPARRGRRRQSEDEDENSPLDENGEGAMMGSSQERHSQPHDAADPAASSFLRPSYHDFAASGSPVSAKDSARAAFRRPSPASLGSSGQELERVEEAQPAYYDLPRPYIPSAHDQENELPSGLKRTKSTMGVLSDINLDKKPLRPMSADIGGQQKPRPASPERKVLASISHNTPHQSAQPPPPPKMPLVETATAKAGAATAQAAKRKGIYLKVNGHAFQRMDCIGRGGSAKVYKVSAENGKMYALKRVSLEGADIITKRGYEGEIDLLTKLKGVDRAIQLIDHEMNNEKNMLSLLMEMGEMDLNTLLRARQNPEGPRHDPVFIRFYWKEMLECVQAVHQHDIVHSDLKPANFVLVQGQLKLIDFGIANAIQTDMTVNVHRENQIGTPNYMSPESLMDSKQYAFTSAHGGRLLMPHGVDGPKLMKLGKPSDVWSLGCILYQMVYGQPPFGRIQNQLDRCRAIIEWKYPIDFPERDEGGAPVSPALLRTMKRCLQREQRLRPTCAQLLSESDPYLYPPEFNDLGIDRAMPVTEELLGRIIQSVVTRCRERMPPDGEVMGAWPAAYWASVRKAVTQRDGAAAKP